MTTIADVEFNRMDGTVASLADHLGSVILVVNVASKCGLTPQYEALEELYAELRSEGLVVVAFPANDFGGQEPGTDDEIAEFCSTTYSVTFPIMSKISVVGEDQHPLYKELTAQAPSAEGKAEFRETLRGHGMTPTEDPDVLWNFEKFLISKDGRVVRRFAPTVSPRDPDLLAAVRAELEA